MGLAPRTLQQAKLVIESPNYGGTDWLQGFQINYSLQEIKGRPGLL